MQRSLEGETGGFGINNRAVFFFMNSCWFPFAEEELSFKCKKCGEMFFSNNDRMFHMIEKHKECQDIVTCHMCVHIAPNKHALRRHFLRMHPRNEFRNFSIIPI